MADVPQADPSLVGTFLPGASSYAPAPAPKDPGNGFSQVADPPDNSVTQDPDYLTKPVGPAGTYKLPNGNNVKFDNPPSHADLDHAQANTAPIVGDNPDGSHGDDQPNDLITKGVNWLRNKYGLGDIGQADPNDWSANLNRGVANAGRRDIGAADLGLTYALPTLSGDRADALKAADDKYDQTLKDNPEPTNNTAQGVGADIGHAATGALAAAAGGLPLLGAEGAAVGAANAGAASGYKSGPMELGGAMGAATSILPVPFLKGGGGPIWRGIKGAAGGSLTGAAGAAGQDYASNYAKTGDLDPLDADYSDVPRGAAVGAALGAPFGVANGVGASADTAATASANASSPHDPANPAEAIPAAKGAVAQDLQNQHNAGFKLNNGESAHVALDNVYTDNYSTIQTLKSQLSDRLDPDQADTLNDVLDRANLNATLKDASNKVKGSASEDDIQKLNDAVGDTQEGQQLIAAVRKANVISDLARSGTVGGISRITDSAVPFLNGEGFLKRLASPMSAIEAGAMMLHPGLAIPAVGTFAAGRAIDAITGNRNPLMKFVGENLGQARPIDTSGVGSLIDQNRMAQYQASEQQASAAQQQQQQAITAAGLKAQAVSNAQKLQELKNYFQYGQGQAARGMPQQPTPPQPSPPQTSFQPSLPAKVAAAPKEAAPALNQAEQAERQARYENNDPGHPSGFDGMVYAKTGLKPQEARAAVQKMADDGVIPQEHADAFRENPRALMAGKVGLQIIDRMQPTSSAVSEPPLSPLRRAAYEAQANGNQTRASQADAHILGRTDVSDEAKKTIRTAIHGISATTNKMSAAALRDQMLTKLSGHEQRVADSVVSPLVDQIRHDTPQQSAAHAFQQPAAQQAIKKAADKLSNGDTSDLTKSDADMVKMFEQQAKAMGKSNSDARLYGMLKMSEWVERGRPMGNGN